MPHNTYAHSRFYIRFPGDNDFINTVTRFARLISEPVFRKRISKAQVIQAFNEHAHSIYQLFQNQLRYENTTGATKEYLQITENDVLFDDEIEESQHFKTKNFNHDGCMVILQIGSDIPYEVSIDIY